MHDPHDSAPLSPLSQSSSGYFSASVSTATLSDVLQPSSSSSSSSSSLLLDAALAANHGGVTARHFLSEQKPLDDSAVPDWLTDGAHVAVGSSKAGTVRYVGATHFAEGVWVGVELDSPAGELNRRNRDSKLKLRSENDRTQAMMLSPEKLYISDNKIMEKKKKSVSNVEK